MTIYVCDGCGAESQEWKDLHAIRWNYNHDTEVLHVCANCKKTMRDTLKAAKQRVRERVGTKRWFQINPFVPIRRLLIYWACAAVVVFPLNVLAMHLGWWG